MTKIFHFTLPVGFNSKSIVSQRTSLLLLRRNGSRNSATGLRSYGKHPSYVPKTAPLKTHQSSKWGTLQFFFKKRYTFVEYYNEEIDWWKRLSIGDKWFKNFLPFELE